MSVTPILHTAFHEVKGKIKESAGKVTNDPNLEVEGKAEHNTGKVEKRSDRSKERSKVN